MTEVRLRSVISEDLPIFYAHQNDPDAAQMAAFPSRNLDAFLAHWNKILADERLIKQTILYDHQVAGNIVSYEQDGRQEVGYWIGKEFWGLGIATQALAILIVNLSARPLYAHVARHNIASRRVLEKCGFELIGRDSWTPAAGGAPVEEYILILR